MFSMPETSVHVLDKNCEISPMGTSIKDAHTEGRGGVWPNAHRREGVDFYCILHMSFTDDPYSLFSEDIAKSANHVVH